MRARRCSDDTMLGAMKGTLLAVLCIAAWSGACAAPRSAAPCPAPRLVPSDLIVGDGALDRGFPGGVSLADIDGDGDLDLMATRGYDTTEQNRPFRYDRSMLYLNDGAGNFSRNAESALSNADNPDSGSTWGDMDGDGDLDAFVSTQHQRPDVFYRNQGGGRFAREELGPVTAVHSSNFTSSWADMDGDGDLDLMSGGPALEPGTPNLAYRNDDGAFVQVSGLAISNGASNPGAVIWIDADNDGDQDLFVANSDVARASEIAPADVETSQLYRNEGGWRFARTEGQAFDDAAYPAIVTALGDIDGDADFDLFLGMQPGPPTRSFSDRLFHNDGQGQFTLDVDFVGPAHNEMAGGAAFADFDGDGDVDLLFGNFNTGVFLYVNDGEGRFSAVADPALNERVTSHAAVVTGDIDGDGDIDAVIGNWGDTHEGEYVTILRNESAACGEPIRLTLRDAHGAPDPIGARVILVTRAAAGERRQVREALGQSGFRGQSASPFVFSVPNGERVTRVEIRWPDGRTQTLTDLSAGDVRAIRQAS